MPGREDTGARETDLGCDATPTLKVVIDGPAGIDKQHEAPAMLRDPETGDPSFNGRLVNRSDGPVSCELTEGYYALPSGAAARNINAGGIWIRNVYLSFDLGSGQDVTGAFDIPKFLDAKPQDFRYRCFPQGAVNVHGHLCVDLRSSIRMVANKVGLVKQ